MFRHIDLSHDSCKPHVSISLRRWSKTHDVLNPTKKLSVGGHVHVISWWIYLIHLGLPHVVLLFQGRVGCLFPQTRSGDRAVPSAPLQLAGWAWHPIACFIFFSTLQLHSLLDSGKFHLGDGPWNACLEQKTGTEGRIAQSLQWSSLAVVRAEGQFEDFTTNPGGFDHAILISLRWIDALNLVHTSMDQRKLHLRLPKETSWIRRWYFFCPVLHSFVRSG